MRGRALERAQVRGELLLGPWRERAVVFHHALAEGVSRQERDDEVAGGQEAGDGRPITCFVLTAAATSRNRQMRPRDAARRAALTLA